jgi:hypothetical protein
MHHLRLIQSAALIAVLLVAGLSVCAHADPAEVGFVPVLTELSCDTARPIDVWIDGSVGDLRGASLVMRFDPNVVRPVAVEEGQLFADASCATFFRWKNEAAIGDSIVVDVAGLGCSVTGPGPIVRVWMTGVADGSTLIRGTELTLRDATNSPIPALWTPAHVIVACPVSAEATSWAALKATFR